MHSDSVEEPDGHSKLIADFADEADESRGRLKSIFSCNFSIDGGQFRLQSDNWDAVMVLNDYTFECKCRIRQRQIDAEAADKTLWSDSKFRALFARRFENVIASLCI